MYSLGDSTLTPTEPALGEGSQQEQPYIVRGLRDPPTLTKAAGQSGSKVATVLFYSRGQSAIKDEIGTLLCFVIVVFEIEVYNPWSSIWGYPHPTTAY